MCTSVWLYVVCVYVWVYICVCVACCPFSFLICTIAQHNCSTISSAARKVSLSLSHAVFLTHFRSYSFSPSLSLSFVHYSAVIRFKNCSLFLSSFPLPPLAIGSHKRASTLIYMFIHTYIYHLCMARAPSHEATLKIGSRFVWPTRDTTSRSRIRHRWLRDHHQTPLFLFLSLFFILFLSPLPLVPVENAD